MHMPKTAGSFLKASLPTDDVHFASHLVSVQEAKVAFPGAKMIMCVRHPVSWYTSLYNFKMSTSPGPHEKDYAVMENNGLQDFLTEVVALEDLGRRLPRWNKPWAGRPHLKTMTAALTQMSDEDAIGFWTLNVLYFGCSRWRSVLGARDVKSLILREGRDLIDVNIILRTEQLAEDAGRLIPTLTRDIDFGRKINATPTDPAIAKGITQATSLILARDGAMARALGYQI